MANLLLIVVLSFATANFFSLQNLLNLLTSYAFSGILASGLVVVLVAGGVDISFTATATIAQYLAVSAVIAVPLGWAGLFGVALGVGLILGLVNACLVTWLRISSILVTIATLNIFYGLLMFFSDGNQITSLPAWYADGLYVIVGYDQYQVPYILNMQMLFLFVALVLSWILLNKTSVGRQIRALGGNPDAARRMGFDALKLNMVAYGFMGLMAGLASLVQAQVAQSVVPNALVGRELDVLTAVVLGGAMLTGGVGSVLGTFLGLMLLANVQTGLVLLGVSSYWSDAVTGVVFLGAVATIAWERQRQQRAVRRKVGVS